MFKGLSIDETRQYCKETLDSLEFWLRRIIDQILSKNYGQDYFLNPRADGSFLIKSEIRKNVKKRVETEPERFDKAIYATFLEDIIYIICNPNLYNLYFKNIFSNLYPEGVLELRTFITRLIEPRNFLAHSNPITTKQAEQVICYSHDIIDSIKDFYKRENMQEEYNVPTIMCIMDSFGNSTLRSDFSFLDSFDFSKNIKNNLRPGDCLGLEVQVDPSFQENEYKIEWHVLAPGFDQMNDKKVNLKIENRHVAKQFTIECRITSVKDWHAHGYFDDKVQIYYKVLPPV